MLDEMGQLLNFTYKVVSPKAGDRVFGSKSGQGTVFENYQKKSQKGTYLYQKHLKYF